MSEFKQCIRCKKNKTIQEFKITFGTRLSATCLDCLEEKTKQRAMAEKREATPIIVSYRYLHE